MTGLRTLCFLLLLALVAPLSKAQLGKSIMIPAGSEVDHQLAAINAATDPAAKLTLIDQFAQAHPDGDFAILADEQYVNYYLAAKQYDKAFEYGDKLFARDPDNYANAVNLVRAANEKGDPDRVLKYAEKGGEILQRYKASPPPSGMSADGWTQQKAQTLGAVKDNQNYIEQSFLSAAYQQKDPVKKAEALQRFAKDFPDSPNAEQALGQAAFAYQQAQNRPKMIEVANSLLAKNPDDIGMLLLLADDYSEKNEQLDKAAEYAKKAAALCDTTKKPDGMSDADWQSQISLQKGLALSALGQVDLEKKLNPQAVESLTKAAPLLKANAVSYARNQYRLGFAYLNLKKNADAKQAFTDAASVDSPYKGPAQDKLKGLSTAKPAAGAKKASS
jgi:tetratricopeptide (TPR) repeat protein